MKKAMIFPLACVAVLVGVPRQTQAGPLFGVDLDDDDLLTINTSTGAATVVAPLGTGNVRGLAFDGSGTLFGADTVTDELLTIDTSTGAATAVGVLIGGLVVYRSSIFG